VHVGQVPVDKARACRSPRARAAPTSLLIAAPGTDDRLDVEAERGTRTRVTLLDRYQDSHTIIAGEHFAGSGVRAIPAGYPTPSMGGCDDLRRARQLRHRPAVRSGIVGQPAETALSVLVPSVLGMAYPTTHPPEAADQDVVDLSGAPAARLTAPSELGQRLAALDERYIRDNFVPLDEVAVNWPGGPVHIRAEIAARRLPQPAYRLDDGTDMVPADYLAPVSEAGSIEGLRDWFEREYIEAARRFEVDSAVATIHEEWQAYLGGGYFVCLRHATPAAIAEKTRRITDIDRLLADPHPADATWQEHLRHAVESLAAIERQFAILDPARWGTPMSGAWYGTFLRTMFAAAFA
jgi:hypothetical protein